MNGDLPTKLEGYTEDVVALRAFEMKGIWTWPCLIMFFLSLLSPQNRWIDQNAWHKIAIITGLALFLSFFIAASLTPKSRFTGKPMRTFTETSVKGVVKYYVCDSSKTYFRRTIMSIQVGKGSSPVN